MKPYLVAFHLALAERLAYRLQLILLFVQDLAIFGALAFFFFAFPKDADILPQLFTTVMLSALIAPFLIYPILMHNVADEIADGDLAAYLLRPVRYIPYWASRSLAVRCLHLFSGALVVVCLFLLLPTFPFVFSTSAQLFASLGLLLGGLILAMIFEIGAGFAAFWLHRSFGPRWFVYVLLQFLSSIYTPFVLFPESARAFLSHTPFAYIAHAPIEAYLGNITGTELVNTFFLQWIWIALFAAIMFFAWQRGVKSYEAYGR